MSRKTLSLEDKAEIINFYEKNKPTLRILASTFTIGKTQASKIIKDKELILKNLAENDNAKTDGQPSPKKPKKEGNEKRVGKDGKSNLTPQGQIIDKLCYEWYLDTRRQGLPITGPKLKEKALQIARDMNLLSFTASNGWLQRWRVRNNVNFKEPDLNISNLPTDPVENFENLYQDYLQKHISNHAESGISPETESFIKNAWESVKKQTIEKYFEKPKETENGEQRNEFNSPLNNFTDDSLDPLSFSEVNYIESNADEDMNNEEEILGGQENAFQIDSYESALTVVACLKHFALNDKIAIEHLTKLEKHFQKKAKHPH